MEEVKTYYDNGQLYSQGSYVQGKKEGKWTYWRDNGQLYFQHSYVQGKEEGEWTFWYSNGKLHSKGYYDQEKEGICIIYGQATIYVHGKQLTEKQCRSLCQLQARIKRIIPILRFKRYLPAILEIWYTPGCKGAWRVEQSFKRKINR
uniref:MORN repeat protein n=1 Tax=viral metagenome TaxID=1070528 RepID=A0A6C0EM28_9ZZZZ